MLDDCWSCHDCCGVLYSRRTINHLFLLSNNSVPAAYLRLYMDEGTIKTPIPKCRLYWCFCFGWCSNFVGSESGQKQSVKRLQNMVYNTTQHPPPSPPQPHTVCIVYTLYVYFGKGGRGGGCQGEGSGATVYKRGRKYCSNMPVSSVYKLY